MTRRPPSVLLGIAAAAAVLLSVAASTTVRAELPLRSGSGFRSSLHWHAHRHRCDEPGLSQPVPEDEDDDGITDDDAAVHVSVVPTLLAVADLPTVFCDAQDSAPASEHTDTGAPRGPPHGLPA